MRKKKRRRRRHSKTYDDTRTHARRDERSTIEWRSPPVRTSCSRHGETQVFFFYVATATVGGSRAPTGANGVRQPRGKKPTIGGGVGRLKFTKRETRTRAREKCVHEKKYRVIARDSAVVLVDVRWTHRV